MSDSAANEPEFDVPPRPTTDEEIAKLPVLDPALLDPPAASVDRCVCGYAHYYPERCNCGYIRRAWLKFRRHG